ncbi:MULTISPECIES: enoyl-CoA hydratase [unclassified Brevundimonas]|uniref:enoyl-CoA hydratase n=1 Tax=unclassified Brevundimonas TaxID=2622653 RepID=UPI000CFD37F2|nr:MULTISPECIES: enoyl-CoA hydratase [unclassified Brevundimonas]PRA34813.1 enoyl-CoA hydratase [Brevundimonas sp. MYb27]PQZ83378.1 enoyl-CoA hydratase [Brevundimonas sp. MYb31]PRB14348.1 enoyl-CoA hydratase [Brevundimonas sp. MYb52]PRB35407.1 enoyl-CoA hydratase [Brevundimonas sp. MYb46]PRB40032.1 enoyl-CoA hydratase [Brevundimonas sp. MYb33]
MADVYSTLLIERHAEGYAVVTLNRPEALNALNTTLTGELGDFLESVADDDSVRCVVLTGSVKAFAAGADIKEMADQAYADMYRGNFFARAHDRVASFRKPIIAAVSGYALGGGCELAMLCDFIIASETAKFGQPEINLGVAPGIGGSQRLTRAVGKAKAMDMCLTGRMMDAAEAERSGLVSRVVASEALLDEARATAAKIAGQSILAVMANKELVNAAFETTLAQGVVFERRLFHSLFAFDDQKEGMAAFVEKRKPAFTGR